MKLRLAFGLLVVGWFVSCANADTAQHPATHEVLCDGLAFTLPKGFTVTKIADEPLVKWPIVADWDSQGRLVVAESGGVGWPIQEHNEQQLHRIIRLVDRDGDGTFDERIVAAEGLAFPEGVLCLDNEILVAAPPVIWKLIDADGDGRCEERQVWFDGSTVTNCANDLHGPYLGHDGWIYWCKGAFGEQTHELLDGRRVRSTAAHIYRRRLSGGAIEPLISGGMDNPVEVAFLETGDKFFTSTFLHHPGDNLRDGIGHAVYGSVFGKDHQVVNNLTKTGSLMKPTIELGPAAPSGLLAASPFCKANFGVDKQSPLLASALFNLHTVMLHRLSESGSTFNSIDSELIRTDRADFHPTDVIEDGYGNLLLIDTGGWYDLCCPTSRVNQSTASGGIYRIEPIGDPESAGHHGFETVDEIPWEDLEPHETFSYFHDPRPWVRRTAKLRFREVGDAGITICRSVIADPNASLTLSQSAVWALCRLDSPASATALLEEIENKPPEILLPILHSISLRRISHGTREVESHLVHPSPAVRRVAAQALGRISGPASVRLILDALGNAEDDRHLQHALTYALIEIGRRHGPMDYVAQAKGDAALHAALVATRELGQVNAIAPSILEDCLDRGDSALRSTAMALLADRPDAAPMSIERLRLAWANFESGGSEPPQYFTFLIRNWREDPAVRQLVRDWYGGALELNRAQQLFLAKHLNQLFPLGEQVGRARLIVEWLNVADAAVQQALLLSLRDAEYSGSENLIVSSLLQRARSVPEAKRLEWLSALPAGAALSDAELAQAVIESVTDEDAGQALIAAQVLDRVRLDVDSAKRLLSSLSEVSARNLPTIIETVYRSGDTDLQIALLDALEDLPAARTLREDYLRVLVRNATPNVRQRAEDVSALLARPAVDVRRAVVDTLSKLPTGDPVRGLQVFRGNKAACSSCHQMGYIGKNVGPVLTRIGGSRTAEALLEAILFPNSRLEQSYRSRQILTTDGQSYNGLIERRDDGSLTLRLNADRLVSIPIEEIELEQASDISVMPSGMRELLTDQDLADLLALLQSAK